MTGSDKTTAGVLAAAAPVKAEQPEFEGRSVSMLKYSGLDNIRYLNPEGSDAASRMESTRWALDTLAPLLADAVEGK